MRESKRITVDSALVARCSWCGITESNSWRTSYRGGGLYCSSVCFYAAFEGPALCFVSLSLMVTVISIVLLNLPLILLFGLFSAIFIHALIKGEEGALLQGKYLDDQDEEIKTKS